MSRKKICTLLKRKSNLWDTKSIEDWTRWMKSKLKWLKVTKIMELRTFIGFINYY